MNGVVQECAAFNSADVSLPVARSSRPVRLCCVYTYQQDYREWSVVARFISLAVFARAATGYAGSATF